MLGFAALLPVIVYPLMKRITYWPQAFLGNYGTFICVFNMRFEMICISIDIG